MWSYIQYRKIGKEVIEQQARRKSTATESAGHGAEESPDLEVGEPSFAKVAQQFVSHRTQKEERNQHNVHPQLDGGKKDNRIWVRSTGETDPLDPRNWPLFARCKNIAILSLLIFVQGWAGSAESMANSSISKTFHVGKVAENLSTAMYLFGIGSGCLFAGPVSETIGRNPTYLIATFCYLLFVLGSALTPNLGGQVVCRYFIGLCCSATLGINGASVRDQFHDVKRAFVFPVIAWANVAAPVIAPIVGGWIVSHPTLSWRWTEWITLIISGVAFMIAFCFLPETYLPILLDWKARQLRRITGDNRFVSDHAEAASFIERIRSNLPLPVTFFKNEPVITVLGVYLTLLYILLFSFLSGFEYIFQQTYNLSPGLTGSCFGAIAAGSTTFLLFAPILYWWSRVETEFVRRSTIVPEFRLWPAIVAAPLLPIALFWLGWSNYATVSIWSSLCACFVFGIVLIAIYVSSYEYIVDSYREHAAVALASITMLRYLVSGGIVMVTRPMYEGIGVHWTMTLLGCIAALLAPAPFLFWKHGAGLRRKSSYAQSSDTT